MNYALLIQALTENKSILGLGQVGIKVESLSFEEQKILLGEILKEGEIICKLNIPEKSTEEISATFTWQNEVAYLSLGYFNLPALRKSSKRETGMGFLMRTLVEDILSSPKGKLDFSNKSLVKYALAQVDLSKVKIKNGTWNKEKQPLPEKYNSMDKVFAAIGINYPSEAAAS